MGDSPSVLRKPSISEDEAQGHEIKSAVRLRRYRQTSAGEPDVAAQVAGVHAGLTADQHPGASRDADDPTRILEKYRPVVGGFLPRHGRLRGQASRPEG